MAPSALPLSMSQRKAMRLPAEISEMSLEPLPPQPMAATLSCLRAFSCPRRRLGAKRGAGESGGGFDEIAAGWVLHGITVVCWSETSGNYGRSIGIFR